MNPKFNKIFTLKLKWKSSPFCALFLLITMCAQALGSSDVKIAQILQVSLNFSEKKLQSIFSVRYSDRHRILKSIEVQNLSYSNKKN